MKRNLVHFTLGAALWLLLGVPLADSLTFEDWQAAHFTAAELDDPAISGVAANPAGDGLSNLLKYAFDLDPHAPAIDGAPAPQFLGGALALHFLHRPDASDLDYALEASSDLFHWSIPNTLSLAATLPLDGIEQWTVLNPYLWPADLPQFLRLRVTRTAVPLLLNDPPQMIRVRTIAPPLGLEIHWADRSNMELGYRIERQRAAEGWELFGITGPDTIFYPDHTVQSGTSYAYRVRAFFAGGLFSAWSGSGRATPVPPGGTSGGGGPGGDPAPPDPDPDTDEDTFKDSVDAYPHDKRRSRDLPTLTYAEIDISTPIIGTKSVTMIALDDQNQVAFSYLDDAADYDPETLHVIRWKDGAQFGTTFTYTLRNDDGLALQPFYLNANGQLAGIGEDDTHSAFFTASDGGMPTFSHGYCPLHLLDRGGFNNAGILWGLQTDSEGDPGPAGGYWFWKSPLNLSFIGTTDFAFADHPTDENHQIGPAFEPHFVNATGQAVGSKYDGSLLRYFGGTPQSLPAKSVLALGDGGTVLGLNPAGATLPGLPAGALSAFLCPVTTGQKTDVTSSLPSEFRRQIYFHEYTTAQMNSAGDILFTTPTLEGPEDAPAWNEKNILWTRQTSIAHPNGTLAQVPNPADGNFKLSAGIEFGAVEP